MGIVVALLMSSSTAAGFSGAMTSDNLYRLCARDDAARCEAYIAGVVDGIAHEHRFDKRAFCFPRSWTVADGRRIFVNRFAANQRSHPGAWTGRDGALIVATILDMEYRCE